MIKRDWKFVFCLLFFSLGMPTIAAEAGYPRIMGIAIAEPSKYEVPERTAQLSKVDILILNFWPEWRNERYGRDGIKTFVNRLKAINPDIKIGQYTNLNEAKDSTSKDIPSKDIAAKIDKENWWLRGPTGGKVQHTTAFGAWEVNLSSHTKPDRNGMRYPQWLAQRNYEKLFKNSGLDFWFLDISIKTSPVLVADWKLSGIPVLASSEETGSLYRNGHLAYWNAIRKLQPDTLLIGNSDILSSSEYNQQLNGALLETLISKKSSLYRYHGWQAVLDRYYDFMRQTKSPHWVGFNVRGKRNDYQLMRFGLATCLLNNGYYSYTDEDRGYTEIPWFDEFNVDLGNPLESPPELPWKDGVYRRLFQNGTIFVNPTKKEVTLSLEKTYWKIEGTQDPVTNSGKAVQSITLKPADGIILLDTGTPPAPPSIEIESKSKIKTSTT